MQNPKKKMIKSLNKFLLFLVTLTLTQVHAQSKGADLKRLSSVELQWEDTPGAFMYEVEIFNSKNKRLKKFVSKTSLFKFKSTSGKIKIRGRILDAYGKKGLWSEIIETTVPPDDIKFPQGDTKPIEAKANNTTLKGNVKLDWPEGIQAKQYAVKVYDKDNKVVLEKTVSTLFVNFDLDIGTYQYSITPIGNDFILGKEIMSPRKIEIGSAQLPDERFEVVRGPNNNIQIKMPKKPGLEIYGELEYAHHMAEDWAPVLEYKPFTEAVWSPETKLKPGRYRVGFWVRRTGWVDSGKFKHEFVIKPTEAEIADTTSQP
jgi:hypothetical protein